MKLTASIYRTLLVLLCTIIATTAPRAEEEIRIVTWNMKAALPEAIVLRKDDFANLSSTLNPDVLVLTEVNGLFEASFVAEALEWPEYYGVVTDLSVADVSAFNGLEVAVISRIPIAGAIEFDATPDRPPQYFSHGGVSGAVSPSEEILNNNILPELGKLDRYDRGTLRVDLVNQLTLFPVHLKSNRNSECSAIKRAVSAIKSQDADLAADLEMYFENGFHKATDRHIKNAEKRERMIASVVLKAEEAVSEGRTVIISGDFNVGFEEGKSGSELEDCTLSNFSCETGPFPTTACTGGDGYDDTLAILERSLVAPTSWWFLSRSLGRTYNSTKFADLAIDHIVVPGTQKDLFSEAKKAGETFGSDHYPIWTTYAPE